MYRRGFLVHDSRRAERPEGRGSDIWAHNFAFVAPDLCIFAGQHSVPRFLLDKQEVTGSIPVRPTKTKKALVAGPFSFSGPRPAHALLRATARSGRARSKRSRSSPSLTSIVCDALGLIAGDYSFSYVARCPSGDVEKIKETGQRVVTCASPILAELEARPTEERR